MSLDFCAFGVGRAVGGTYMWDTEPLRPEAALTTPAHVTLATAANEHAAEQSWHRRYGHLGYRNLSRLEKESMVDGMDGSLAFHQQGQESAGPASAASSTDLADKLETPSQSSPFS